MGVELGEWEVGMDIGSQVSKTTTLPLYQVLTPPLDYV